MNDGTPSSIHISNPRFTIVIRKGLEHLQNQTLKHHRQRATRGKAVVCCSNQVSISDGTLVNAVSIDIKPFATIELKRYAIGFKVLLTLHEAGGRLDALGGLFSLSFRYFGRADELSLEGPNEDDDAIVDTEEINVAGEGPPDQEGQTLN
ncbi:hypothetical protein VNO77_16012 [Canavalia gladiata]|uniref:Uncharacterized protein n=1 Tax=Canavalia gladiata TaxID=3824 RepID=A0AAN9QW83_CANGL